MNHQQLGEIRERANLATKALAVSEREAQRAITDRVLLLEEVDRRWRLLERYDEQLRQVREAVHNAEDAGELGDALRERLRQIVGPR